MQMQTNELHHILLTILNLIDGINKRWELNEKKKSTKYKFKYRKLVKHYSLLYSWKLF